MIFLFKRHFLVLVLVLVVLTSRLLWAQNPLNEKVQREKMRALFQLDDDQSALPSSEDDWRLKQLKQLKMIKHIQENTNKTLQLYRGMDDELGRLSSLFMEMYTHPENISRVVWFPLLGFPGSQTGIDDGDTNWSS